MAHTCHRESCPTTAVGGPSANCFFCKKKYFLGCFGVTATVAHWKLFEPSPNIQFVCTECLSSPVHQNQQSQQIQLNESLSVSSPNTKPKTTIAMIANEVTKLQEQFASFQSTNTEVIAKLNSIDANAAEIKSNTTEIKANTESVLCEINTKLPNADGNFQLRFGLPSPALQPTPRPPHRPLLQHEKTPKKSFSEILRQNSAPQSTAKRRRINDKPNDKPIQRSKPIVPAPKVGTNPKPIGSLVAVQLKPAPKKTEKPKFEKAVWISRLPPPTTEDEVRDYISTIESAVSPHFEVHKLVAKGRPLSELKFVSFKISVNMDDFTILNDPSVWPPGILVREFMESKPVTFGDFLPVNADRSEVPTSSVNLMEIAPESPNKQTEKLVVVDP